ncbi:MAG TPA: porin family protein [Balneolaceae bacterium]|nr:porin family protein [Balneolaceae bacterium]
MKKIITIPLILLLFAFPAITKAQYNQSYNNNSNIMLGPRVGYYKASDADDGVFTLGLQLRGHISKWFGLELAASYRSSTEFDYNIGGDNYSAKTGFVPITASAMLYLPINEHLLPYGTAGVGGYYTFRDTDAEGLPADFGDHYSDKFLFGYHLGFGLEVPISNAIAIDADYRYIWINHDDNRDDFDGNSITFGVMFYL